ncbi:CRAL/TRIO domain-containing protein [Paxillus ammoniavirescens]|nr:CRAL/TRIO domain-containing protein [Paxillus ammoniavirescens]
MAGHAIHSSLQETNQKLMIQYDTAQPDVAAILETLNRDVLPHLTIEFGLQDMDVAWVTEWLNDKESIFRLLRRHNFIRTFALKEIRPILIWRLHVLRPALRGTHTKLLHCLPPPIADPLGRPIVLVKNSSIQGFGMNLKDALLQEVERLRLHLRHLRDIHTNERFPLQYIVLVDLQGVSIQNITLDFFSWLFTDVIPRYPGMLAAVFVLNYSWMYSGVWSVAKRVLPSSAISRVFFPSRDQLLDYCSPATLPAEYGGSLPTLDQIEDALRSEYQRMHTAPYPLDFSATSPRSTDPKVLQGPSIKRSPSSSVFLPPTSPLNPFFGYPVVTSSSSPHTIRHVRRRKRDLMRTLAVLWWQRWGSRRAIGLVGVCILLVLSLIAPPARLKRIAISRLRVLGWLTKC